MDTARDFLPSAAPSSVHSAASLWVRLGAAMTVAITAAWKRSTLKNAMSVETPADFQAISPHSSVPIAGKIAAISMAGTPVAPVRKALPRTILLVALPLDGARKDVARRVRRPGVQSRWKASDRVGNFY
jgi:hypothetical protein